MNNMRDRAAVLVAVNWRIQKRLPLITQHAKDLGLLDGPEADRLQLADDHARFVEKRNRERNAVWDHNHEEN
jgi:hypothetical protein